MSETSACSLALSGAVIVSTCHLTRARTARRRWSGNRGARARAISDGRPGSATSTMRTDLPEDVSGTSAIMTV
ncbi:hypothetical protein AB0N14_36020 [Streptomyces sp. NPDC051104]|uniref:hypothetical protein n=1 Tax=Streptomyces sp. NPDC051104 TaxID=3155044 RepID=UPI003424A2EC